MPPFVIPLSHAHTYDGGRRRTAASDFTSASTIFHNPTGTEAAAAAAAAAVAALNLLQHNGHQQRTDRPPRKSVSSPLLHVVPLQVSLQSTSSARPSSAEPSPSPPPPSSPPPPPYTFYPSSSSSSSFMPHRNVQHSSSRSLQNSDFSEDEDEMIYTSLTSSGPGFRHTHTHAAAGFTATAAASPQPLQNSVRPHSHSHSSNSVYPGVRKSHSTSLRHRIFAAVNGIPSARDGGNGREAERGWEREAKAICTTPGMVCAGETETETDEPSRHLPTARISRTSSSLSNSLSLSPTSSFPTLPWQRLLFEFSRLLAIVPASLGFIWCLWHIYMYDPVSSSQTSGRPPPDRIDYIVASLWALLTAHQCLSLTTGLLTRWRHYYAPLSTLVRLLALQGICWPATHLTVNILEAAKRPAAVWAVIGTTTCMSRSIQIWVVSNLPANSASSCGVATGLSDRDRERERENRRGAMDAGGGTKTKSYGYIYWKKWNKWRRRRRWDWREVSIKCMLPAGVLYLMMAWAGEVRKELGGC